MIWKFMLISSYNMNFWLIVGRFFPSVTDDWLSVRWTEHPILMFLLFIFFIFNINKTKAIWGIYIELKCLIYLFSIKRFESMNKRIDFQSIVSVSVKVSKSHTGDHSFTHGNLNHISVNRSQIHCVASNK